MAIRNILMDDNPRLRKQSREVEEITPKILELLDDMAQTMYKAKGLGLAAPQVGMLRRVVVIDVG
ncbi:MAG: peptide deformylase, partial [Eubacteriales bacterium]